MIQRKTRFSTLTKAFYDPDGAALFKAQKEASAVSQENEDADESQPAQKTSPRGSSHPDENEEKKEINS